MKTVSKAQKARLGAFLLIAGVLLGGTLILLIGMAALEERDTYKLYFAGSISGLETGSVVRYNGLPVGRVDVIRIDPKRITEVEVTVSVDGGTIITKDTVALLQMQGITGLKYIELKNLSNDAPRVEPDSIIPVQGSDFDDLAQKATSIANKVEAAVANLERLLADDKIGALIDNVVKLTSGENGAIVTRILQEVEGNLRATRALLENKDILEILTNTRLASAEVVLIAGEVRQTMTEVRSSVSSASTALASVSTAVTTISSAINPTQIKRIISRVEQVLDEVKARVGPAELGTTISGANSLIATMQTTTSNLDITVMRARDDFRRVMDSMISGAENFSDFAQILVDNPAALISGRSESERALP